MGPLVPQPVRAMSVDVDFSPLAVLVIDDCPDARAATRAVLLSFGIGAILEADDGATGFAILAEQRVDLVLVDHATPPMDGIQFTRRIRAGEVAGAVDVPIVIISDDAAMAKVTLARNTGVNEFLIKPIAADSLLRRLRTVLIHPRPFVRSPVYTGPCRRSVDRAPPQDGDRRRNPPLPKPKPKLAANGSAIPTPREAPRPRRTSRKRFATGTVIFREGEGGDEAYVVETGSVAIVKHGQTGDIVLGHVGPQGIFGEMALVDDEPRMATATARDDTVCLVLPKEAVRAQIGRSPDLVTLVLDTLLRNIRTMGHELVGARTTLDSIRKRKG